MNETEKDRLLRLYKLLWEQIKDEEINYLTEQTSIMEVNGVISRQEENRLDDHICSNYDLTESPKAFVQRMIKELENDK